MRRRQIGRPAGVATAHRAAAAAPDELPPPERRIHRSNRRLKRVTGALCLFRQLHAGGGGATKWAVRGGGALLVGAQAATAVCVWRFQLDQSSALGACASVIDQKRAAIVHSAKPSTMSGFGFA